MLPGFFAGGAALQLGSGRTLGPSPRLMTPDRRAFRTGVLTGMACCLSAPTGPQATGPVGQGCRGSGPHTHSLLHFICFTNINQPNYRSLNFTSKRASPPKRHRRGTTLPNCDRRLILGESGEAWENLGGRTSWCTHKHYWGNCERPQTLSQPRRKQDPRGWQVGEPCWGGQSREPLTLGDQRSRESTDGG